MKSFLEYITEEISKTQLDTLEIKLDDIWNSLGMDIEFTKHFLERVNDERNGKPIELKELEKIFVQAFTKYGASLKKLKHSEVEAVLSDIETQINVPFVLKWNRDKKILELVSKTIMRKKDFKTPDKKYVV
jgi:hypothetical protein